MKPDIQDIFVAWKQNCQTDFGKTRFSSVTRKEVIDILVNMLADMSIDYDEAKNLKNQVIKTLITKDGLTGTGKYKGWKQAVEEDFIAILYEAYNSRNLSIKPLSDKGVQNTLPGSQKQPEIQFHELIDIWGRGKFQDAWRGEIRVLANTPHTSLYHMFLDEFFK